MKIEEGKYYRSREGKKVGPMKVWFSGSECPWISPDGSIYRESGERSKGAEKPNTDLISEWKEEEPAMDYATMNEFVGYLRELRDMKIYEIGRYNDHVNKKLSKLKNLIEKIESQYPKPDEEEK